MRVVSQNSYSGVLAKYRRYIVRSDFVIVIAASLVTYGLRFHGFGSFTQKSFIDFFIVFALPTYWLFSLQSCKAWNFLRVESLESSFRSILRASWRATIILGFTSYALHNSISRIWVFSTSVMIFGCLCISRLVVELLLKKDQRLSIRENYLVVAGDSSELTSNVIPLRRINPRNQVNYIWVAPPDPTDGDLWLSKLENLIEIENIDGIVIMASADLNVNLLVRVSKYYHLGITGILLATPLAPELSQFSAFPHSDWVRIEEPQIVNSGSAVKRTFDFIFSIIALVLLSPLLLIIAIGIKISSKGAVLYSAKRLGARGEYFDFPKFRTMVQDADKLRSSVIGLPDGNIAERYKLDPRITNFGRFLRRWSLDELPQLWCVLVGTMSVVGPRPILEEENHLVDAHSRFRSIATPGLTGLWQVSGRKEVGWQERMEMDTYYIQSWSFSHDMLLILKTFSAIFSGHGSY